MSGPASANTIAGIRDGSAWNGDAKAKLAALDALLAGQIPLAEAANIPDGIRAYVRRKHSGVNPLETVPDGALGDTDEAAVERCRRLFLSWAKEAGIDRVRWIAKADGNREDVVAAYAAFAADDLLRLTVLIRHKHRDEPEWNPGTPDEFAADMLLRQVRDLSMGYRTRSMFGSSWKGYARLSAEAQGKFEGLVMRMVALSLARRAAQVAAFNRKFDDRPIPTTRAEANQLMADMIFEVIGRRVEPPADDSSAPVLEPVPVHEEPPGYRDQPVRTSPTPIAGSRGGVLASADPGLRDGLLQLLWAAWFRSRSVPLQQALFRAGAGDEVSSLMAAQEMSGDILKLIILAQRLDQLGGYPSARDAIAGLQEGMVIMGLPPRLERVVNASDSDRARLIEGVRALVGAELTDAAATEVSALLAFLVNVQPTADGRRLVLQPALPQLLAHVLPDLGLPATGYEATLQSWIA